MKPMASRYVILYNSAMSLQSKRTILTQQCLKVILNCSTKLHWKVRASHVSYFVQRMQLSGYDKKFRGEIVCSALKAYAEIKKKSEEGIRPIYRRSTWNAAERKKEKEIKKKQWFKKGGYEAVLFAPATPNSTLAKAYKEKIRCSELKIRVVEKSGESVKKVLQVNDPLSEKKCKKKNECLVCSTEGKGNCKSSSINYEIQCGSRRCDDVYHGHSSKNALTRGDEHKNDLKAKREKSVMWQHCLDKHGGRVQKFKMRINRKMRNNPTKRQITEALYINKAKPGHSMNDKTEWNYVNLPRLQIE